MKLKPRRWGARWFRGVWGSRLRSETQRGSAIIEFVGLAVIVMVPIAYAVIVVVKLNAATYAAVTAAREAGRAYVTSESVSQAGARARLAAQIAMADQGAPAPEVRVSCQGGTCLAPGSRVHVTVTTAVPIPLVPHEANRGTISVTAEHDAVVDKYRSTS